MVADCHYWVALFDVSLDIIKTYDKIGVMKSGKIEELGAYNELMEKKGLLYELVAGGK